MSGFFVRWMITAAGLATAAWLLDGVRIAGLPTLLISALLLGLVNAVIRPVAFVLTLPLTIVTLGLFLLVLNAAMLGLVAWLMPGFGIDSLLAGIAAWLIISFVSWAASQFIGPSGRYELMIVERR